MPVSRLLRAAPIALAALLLLSATSSAATDRLTAAEVGAWDAPIMSSGEDSWVPQYGDGRSAFSQWAAGKAESGGSVSSLPPAQENVELIGELQVDTPNAFKFDPTTGLPDPSEPDVMPSQIADLAVYKNTAYLNSWSDASCRRGGMFVVDISNPRQPRQLSFLPAAPNTRHGEGAIVLTVNTPSGPMDVFATNNEPMPAACGLTAQNAGGFDLWNVTDPNNPVPLALNVGDTGPDDGTMVGAQPVHQSHSTTMWTDDRGRTFVAATDNLEFHDLDIFEITNDPANPRPVAEFDTLDRFPQVRDNSAYGDWIYNHDMSVRKINGVWTLLLNYWDAGYVTLNVDNPADPQYLGDTSFDGPDPLTGWNPPEGNAHQGEFSYDGRYILAADEDFDTHRLVSTINGQPVSYALGLPVTNTTPSLLRSDLVPAPGEPLEGDTRFIGEACSAASVPAPQAGETVAIAARGTCDFEDKAMFAEQAGYSAVLIMNNGAGAAPRCDAVNLNMTTDNVPVPVTIKMLLIPRTIGFRMLGLYDPATYACDPANPAANTPNPPVDTAGLPVRLAFDFDGWGYTHVYENGTGKLRRVDSYAVPEGLDERFATGFGDLTVHEFATDPTEYLAYSSYYAAGMRVLRFGADGLTEVGKYIPERGANFWGVEQFTQNGERYFAGSDRDYGLYIFRYTGPGAAARPACSDANVTVPYQTSVTLSLRCTDANGNRLTRAIASGPANGTLGAVDQGAGTVTYTPRAGYTGPDSFRFTANDGAATSEPATMRITVGPNPRGCRNLIEGTRRGDLLAGTSISDRIRARGGDDMIDASGGGDCLFGQSGRDTIDGERGNDQLSGGPARDIMTGGPGADRLSGAAGIDRMFGNGGNDRLNGGVKRDYLAGGHGNDSATGGVGRDSLVGDLGNDRLWGGAGDDILRGNQGSDRIVGGLGRDLIVGHGGADRINVRDGNVDRVSCGSGRDRAIADRGDRLTGCERINRR